MQNKLIRTSICLMICISVSACSSSQAEPEAQVEATFEATTLPTLTPTIASTSTATPTPTNTPTATPDMPGILTAIAPIASGQGVAEVASYDPAAPGPHRVILFTDSGSPHDWNASLPADWLPSSAGDVELAIFASPEKEVALGSTYYKNGSQNVPVFRYRFEMTIVIREASTGKVLKSTTVRGLEPREFPNALPAGTTRLDGEHVTMDVLRSWLMCNVVMPEVCKMPLFEERFFPIKGLAFSADGDILVSGSGVGIVRLWQVSDGVLLNTLSLASDPIPEELMRPISNAEGYPRTQLDPDGQTWALAEENGTITLDNPLAGFSMQTLEKHKGAVVSVTFSPDGKILASGSKDKTVRLWRVADGSLVLTLEGHTQAVNSVAFSPDGEILASGSSDGTVRLWQVSDGSLLHELRGHTSAVYTVAFSPDGKMLAAGSHDGSVRLWHVEDGSLLLSLWGHTSTVNSVLFSPDGKILASGSDDMTVRLWTLP